MNEFTKIGDLDFGWVLRALKEGRKAKRPEWECVNLWIELETNDEKMDSPFIVICCMEDERLIRMPWSISHADVLSNDWIVF